MILGAKPYAASGEHIDRTSDRCWGCQLDVPWLEGNARMGLVLKAFDRMDPSEVRRIRWQAKAFLAGLD